MKPKLLLSSTIMALLLAAVVILGGTDAARAQTTFNPNFSVSVANPETGAASDYTVEFGVPEGDVNFGAVVIFIPNEWDLADSEDVPLGTVIADLEAESTLGLINNPCNNPLPVRFTMLAASTDISDTVNYLDTDEPGDPGFGLDDVFEDKDDSGLQDGIERYPDFINRVLVDENDEPQQPTSRAVGTTVVAGVNVILQFLVFEPGTFLDERIPSDPDLGRPTVVLLQNVGDPDFDPVPSAITDFCSPLSSTTVSFGISKDNGCTDVGAEELDPICDVTSVVINEEGGTEPDESGITIFTNPPEGTYTFTAIAAGLRDADADGYENPLDTCPFDPNVGNPRVAGDGDADNDGLDAACDPDDNDINSDEDLDGYPNRGDNCPLEPNGEESTNQRDTDNDFIGDACDPDPDCEDCQGEPIIVELEQDLTIGPGSDSGRTPPADGTPGGGTVDQEEDEDGGLGTGAIIAIIIGVVAGVVVLGGGAFFVLRGRGRSGGSV